MMKNHAMDAIIRVDTTVGFLSDREQVIDLSPSRPSEPSGYVWKRVFLRAKSRRV